MSFLNLEPVVLGLDLLLVILLPLPNALTSTCTVCTDILPSATGTTYVVPPSTFYALHHQTSSHVQYHCAEPQARSEVDQLALMLIK